MTAGERLMAQGMEKGLREGLEKGRREGEARLLLEQLRLRFGPPAPEVVARVEAAPLADLERWGERILTAATLEEVLGEG
jgi:predicted transposase YdaD